jgi:hypothetical protein
MPSTPDEAFANFAARCHLQLRADPLVRAPRDVLAAPAKSDQYYLVTLTGHASGASVRSVFVTLVADPSPPGVRDVLWWLAADAWAVRQSGRDLARWAREYRYPTNDEVTFRLFKQHLAQNDALELLLGQADYDRLLALQEAEVTRAGTAQGGGSIAPPVRSCPIYRVAAGYL